MSHSANQLEHYLHNLGGFMKLKALTFGTLAASTVLFTSAVVSSAEAATVTGTLNFAKDAGVRSITNSKVDFRNVNNFFSVGETSTGTFAGLRGDGITILNDINLSSSGPFDFLRVDNGGSGIVFRVTGFGTTTVQVFNGVSTFSGNILGNFILDGDSTPVKSDSFILTARNGGSSSVGVSLRSTAEAVPTPALLPGLVGMGIGALRKRKSAESETVDA
jgi:hypothetical protein